MSLVLGMLDMADLDGQPDPLLQCSTYHVVFLLIFVQSRGHMNSWSALMRESNPHQDTRTPGTAGHATF